MHGKKNETVSIKKLRKVLLNLGLIISLSLTITAFEWNFKGENFVMQKPDELDSVFEFYPPLTIQDAPEPPEPIEAPVEPPTELDQIDIDNSNDPIEGEDDPIIIAIDSSFNTDGGEIESSDVDDEIEDAVAYVDIQAQPIIGLFKFRHDVAKEVVKSLSKRDKMKLRGSQKLIVEFIVEKNGDVTNISIAKSIIKNADNAAKMKIKNSGKWTPGQLEGRVVRQRFHFPIKVTLQD